MRGIWSIGLALAAMWVSTGAAIITALKMTQKPSVLWFFLIPALCSTFKYTRESDEDGDGK